MDAEEGVRVSAADDVVESSVSPIEVSVTLVKVSEAVCTGSIFKPVYTGSDASIIPGYTDLNLELAYSGGHRHLHVRATDKVYWFKQSNPYLLRLTDPSVGRHRILIYVYFGNKKFLYGIRFVRCSYREKALRAPERSSRLT